MLFLLLSIACSSAIMLLFKAFETYRIDNFQAIVFNYITCFCVGLLTVDSSILSTNFWETTWFQFAAFLGCIFIASFQLIALTTQRNGLTVTTIAHKTTMVLPVMVAFFLYDDEVTFAKITGIVLAIAAVFLTSIKDTQELGMEGEEHPLHMSAREGSRSVFLLPVTVFLFGGFIEVVINYVQVHYLEEKSANAFAMFIFTTAAVIGSVTIAFQALTGGRRLKVRNVLAGFLLGVPNYGSIYFLIMALDSSGLQSSVVFPLNNISIVVVTSFLAFGIYDERLSKMNLLGVVCAIVAILLMLG